MNEFTTDGIVTGMMVGFGLVAVLLAVLTLWLWDKAERVAVRLARVERYLEAESASRRPAHSPPPPPPFERARCARTFDERI